jgi:hypothetical protein
LLGESQFSKIHNSYPICLKFVTQVWIMGRSCLTLVQLPFQALVVEHFYFSKIVNSFPILLKFGTNEMCARNTRISISNIETIRVKLDE